MKGIEIKPYTVTEGVASSIKVKKDGKEIIISIVPTNIDDFSKVENQIIKCYSTKDDYTKLENNLKIIEEQYKQAKRDFDNFVYANKDVINLLKTIEESDIIQKDDITSSISERKFVQKTDDIISVIDEQSNQDLSSNIYGVSDRISELKKGLKGIDKRTSEEYANELFNDVFIELKSMNKKEYVKEDVYNILMNKEVPKDMIKDIAKCIMDMFKSKSKSKNVLSNILGRS